jgi:biopolymer transport protein ExbD
VKFRRETPPEVAINIAPLVDVVFLLVIFFAVSTTFLETAGLKLELPTSSSNATRKPEELVVTLATDGSLSFRGERIEREGLRERLRETLAGVHDKIVVLQADRRTEHGTVVELMDLIRDAGATGLTVRARSPAG